MIKRSGPRSLSDLNNMPLLPSAVKLCFRIALPAMLVTALIIAALHYADYSIKMNIVKAKEVSRIDIGTESIRRQFSAITSDLRYLATSGYLMDFMAGRQEEEKEILAREFLAITRTKGIYDQIRYMDKSGMEVVRVNRNVDRPHIVPGDKLQNKGNRYYFQDTMGISCREVFVSPLDLNIENGEIERPLKPMIRFGMPACDRDGRKQGAILFNYLGAQLLGNLKEMLGEVESRTMLLNNDGFWLLAPDPEDEWGFMFKKDKRWQNRFPAEWEKVKHDKSGQVETDAGIFTFETIYPLEEGQASSTGSGDTASSGRKFIEAGNYYWVLILHVPKEEIAQRVSGHLSRGSFQFLLVMVLLLPLTWLFSRERVRATLADEAVNRSEEFTRAVASQLAEGLMVLDREGRFQMINPKAERLLGWREAELLNGGVAPIMPEWQPGKEGCKISECMEKGVCQKVEPFYLNRKKGDAIPVSLSVAPMYNHGNMIGVIITFQDIAQRLAIEEQLRAMATHDPLTGVKNRGELERLTASEMERCRRYEHPFSLLMIDIDHFKKINDTQGHQRGDEVLKIMCRYIESILRKNDVIGRYGGEEFVVMLPETECSQAEIFAARLKEGVGRNAGKKSGGSVPFTVSIGVACFPEHGNTEDDLLKKADDALYTAKKQGRDRVVTAS